jgi:hypothetical protein
VTEGNYGLPIVAGEYIYCYPVAYWNSNYFVYLLPAAAAAAGIVAGADTAAADVDTG